LEFPQFGYDVLSESPLVCFRLMYTNAALPPQPASSTRSSSASATRRWRPARAARASAPGTAAPLPPLSGPERKNWSKGSDVKAGGRRGPRGNQARERRIMRPNAVSGLARGHTCLCQVITAADIRLASLPFLCSLGRGRALACPSLSGSVFAQAWKLVGSPAFPNATRTTELAGFGSVCSALDRTV